MAWPKGVPRPPKQKLTDSKPSSTEDGNLITALHENNLAKEARRQASIANLAKARAAKKARAVQANFEVARETLPPLNVNILELAKPKPALQTRYAFGIEHEGQALYGVTMYTLIGDKIVEKHKIHTGDFAKNCVRRLAQSAIQIELNQMKPDKLQRFEVMPSISGQRL